MNKEAITRAARAMAIRSQIMRGYVSQEEAPDAIVTAEARADWSEDTGWPELAEAALASIGDHERASVQADMEYLQELATRLFQHASFTHFSQDDVDRVREISRRSKRANQASEALDYVSDQLKEATAECRRQAVLITQLEADRAVAVEALEAIASCEKRATGDVVDVARQARARIKGDNRESE